VRWFDEEREALKSKGARDEVLNEPAFLRLFWDAVIGRHSKEILADPELLEEILIEAAPHARTYS
jgi:hypothetical protein